MTTKTKTSYHHGDLRPTLLIAATEMVNEGGVEALSLRKLAEKVGVSRTATYHHFKDKHDLLCAVAAQGFANWQDIEQAIFNDCSLSTHERYRKFVFQYIEFAAKNPALYDLMFGSTLWKDGKSNKNLRDVAYPAFQHQVDMTKAWQENGILPRSENTLRLAQVTWGTMHGIARLLIDGIYADASSVEEMCECAVNLFLNAEKTA
ncbi:TetR/AcrR family transcriptional regulator [Thalassotalea euphylliae]|uniref:TetR/AcrR family transcriptional regulator n=1 Tax=Thalassotalea euphylliae TaxID=1655234 RepID=UPI00363AC1FD